MAEVLVLVELNPAGGGVRKTTLEALTAARALGEPSAVVIGAPGTAAGVRDTLAEYGAARVHVAVSPEVDAYLVAPKAEVLAQLVADRQPAAVVVPSLAVEHRLPQRQLPEVLVVLGAHPLGHVLRDAELGGAQIEDVHGGPGGGLLRQPALGDLADVLREPRPPDDGRQRRPGERDQQGARLRRPPAEGRGREGHRRGRRRPEVRRVPRQPEDRLSRARTEGRGAHPWQKFWSWPS